MRVKRTPLPIPVQPRLCRCVHPNPVACLAQRHEVTLSMAHVFGGCDCLCHVDEQGVLVLDGVWLKMREKLKG